MKHTLESIDRLIANPILDKTKLDEIDENDFTPLTFIVRNTSLSDTQILAYIDSLLNKGADVNQTDGSGKNVFFYALTVRPHSPLILRRIDSCPNSTCIPEVSLNHEKPNFSHQVFKIVEANLSRQPGLFSTPKQGIHGSRSDDPMPGRADRETRSNSH